MYVTMSKAWNYKKQYTNALKGRHFIRYLYKIQGSTSIGQMNNVKMSSFCRTTNPCVLCDGQQFSYSCLLPVWRMISLCNMHIGKKTWTTGEILKQSTTAKGIRFLINLEAKLWLARWFLQRCGTTLLHSKMIFSIVVNSKEPYHEAGLVFK